MDFTEQSYFALDTAIRLGQRHRASLTLIYIINDATMSNVKPGNNYGGVDAVTSAKAMLAEYTTELEHKHQLPVNYAVEIGRPALTICQYAARRKMDLIVIGTKRNRRIQQLLGKTIAYQVIHLSPCPVLSVPATTLVKHFRKIIFPVRRVPHMLDKYSVVRPIVTANDSVLIIAGLSKTHDVEGLDQINNTLKALQPTLRYDMVDYSTRIHRCDSLSDQLLEISAREKPDLIVIVARLNNLVKHHLLEYYARTIVSRSPCPVLTLPPRVSVLTRASSHQVKNNELTSTQYARDHQGIKV